MSATEASMSPGTESPITRLLTAVSPIYRGLDFLAPVGFLLLRCWIAWQFFKSGLTKISTFDSTLLLFEYEYSVPLLPPAVAAYLATAAELVLPILLIIGLFGRISALGLFILNFVAVISYADATLKDHLPWGLILLVFTLHGPGKLSLDYLINRYFVRQTP